MICELPYELLMWLGLLPITVLLEMSHSLPYLYWLQLYHPVIPSTLTPPTEVAYCIAAQTAPCVLGQKEEEFSLPLYSTFYS